MATQEEERYRYLKLKQKQAMASQQQPPQHTGGQPVQQKQPSTIAKFLQAVMANAPINKMRALTDEAMLYKQNPNISEQEVSQAMQQRATNEASKGAYAQVEMPINAALTIEGGAIAKPIVGAISKALKPILKWDSALQQAGKAQQGLDTLQGILGKAKELAIQEVKNVPAQVDFGKNNVPKIIEHIKNPMYGVEFTQTGDVVRTVGNLDKIKMAVDDMIHSPKVWDEATTMEQRYIKMFRNELKNSMIKASQSVGKDIKPALDAYSEFKDNSYLIKKTIQDTAGNAQANNLKAAFKLGAEPATKEAWKAVAQASPEVKEVMNSMNRRELMNNLLKVSGYGALGTGAVGGIKNLISR
jgi:hypothetical protein